MSDYDIKFAQVGQMKLGQFIVIEDVICKIDSMDRSKPGKHGAAKIRMTATGVFNGKKMNLLKPTDTAVEVPLLGKGNAQIIADLGDKYQVMDTADYQTYEIDKADFKNLNAGDNIEYLKAGALIKIVREKSGNE
ncbi:MAG: translation initiation factor IF-5A [archaeon]